MRTKDLFNFIRERYQIAIAKNQGKPKPWTADKILQRYRFCNIYREWDTVTEWISDNWRSPNLEEPDLWFAMCVARFVNWPESLQEIGFPIPWDPSHFRHVLKKRAQADKKVFTGAYLIPANGPKIAHVENRILTPIWRKRDHIRPVDGDKLQDFFDRLHAFRGFGSFMTGQVIADIKYVQPLERASDWLTWASSGPGSRRGMNRVCRHDVDSRWKESEWKTRLMQLKEEIDPLIEEAEMPPLHAQDLQNCLCEWDKYERTRLGEGRPRSKYPGQEETHPLFR